jgi:hypothetical protein
MPGGSLGFPCFGADRLSDLPDLRVPAVLAGSQSGAAGGMFVGSASSRLFPDLSTRPLAVGGELPALT